MVMPIWDHSPFKWPTPPYMMWLLIVANFAVFFLQVGAGSADMDRADQIAGLIPATFTGATIRGALPAPLTLITYQFLHADFMARVRQHDFPVRVRRRYRGGDRALALSCLLSRLRRRRRTCLRAQCDRVRIPNLSELPASIAGVVSAYLMYRPCAKVTVPPWSHTTADQGVTGSLAAGRSGKSSKPQARCRMALPIGRMSAGLAPAPSCSWSCARRASACSMCGNRRRRKRRRWAANGYRGHLPPPIPPR